MSDTPKPPPPAPTKAKAKPPKPGATREERLKAALKANMARRKAQGRARSDAETSSD